MVGLFQLGGILRTNGSSNGASGSVGPPEKRPRVLDKNLLIDLLTKYRLACDFTGLANHHKKAHQLQSSILKQSPATTTTTGDMQNRLSSLIKGYKEMSVIKDESYREMERKEYDWNQVQIPLDYHKCRSYCREVTTVSEETAQYCIDSFVSSVEQSIKIGMDEAQTRTIELLSGDIRAHLTLFDAFINYRTYFLLSDYQEKMQSVQRKKDGLAELYPTVTDILSAAERMSPGEYREKRIREIESLRGEVDTRSGLIDAILNGCTILSTNSAILDDARKKCLDLENQLREKCQLAFADCTQEKVDEFKQVFNEFSAEYAKITQIVPGDVREYCDSIVLVEQLHNRMTEYTKHFDESLARKASELDNAAVRLLKETINTKCQAIKDEKTPMDKVITDLRNTDVDLAVITGTVDERIVALSTLNGHLLDGIRQLSLNQIALDDVQKVELKKVLKSAWDLRGRYGTVRRMITVEGDLKTQYPEYSTMIKTQRSEMFTRCDPNLTLLKSDVMITQGQDCDQRKLLSFIGNGTDVPLSFCFALLLRKINFTTRYDVTAQMDCIEYSDGPITQRSLKEDVTDADLKKTLLEYLSNSCCLPKDKFYDRLFKCCVPWRTI